MFPQEDLLVPASAASADADDKPHEECGVFGIYAPGKEVARHTFFALYALQHRGQEAAGIVTCDGQTAHVHKRMGLVSQVFNEENLLYLKGHLAIGHNRYSTTGSSRLRNTQPYVIETIDGPLAIAHNGNLINAPQLRRELLERGVGLSTSSDSEVIIHLLAGAGAGDWLRRIKILMAKAEGAYTLTILTRDAIYGVRDPWGLRPLVLAISYQGPGEPGWHRLRMTLRSEPSATGRADAVLAALGLGEAVARIERLQLIFAEERKLEETAALA